LAVAAQLLFACGVGLAETHPSAQMQDIAFDERGGAALRTQVAPGKAIEWCGMMLHGDDVYWEFESADPLDMNLHFHEGNTVTYSVRAEETSTRSGRLLPAVERPHCWMWTNHRGAPVALQARLQKAPRRTTH
jgi:hypothetical protein